MTPKKLFSWRARVVIAIALCAASISMFLAVTVGVERGAMFIAMRVVQVGQSVGVLKVHDFLIPTSEVSMVDSDVSPELKAYTWIQIEFLKPLLARATSLEQLRSYSVVYTAPDDPQPQGSQASEAPLEVGVRASVVTIPSQFADDHVIEADLLLSEGVADLKSSQAVLIALHGGAHIVGSRNSEFGAAGLFVHELKQKQLAALNVRQRFKPEASSAQLISDIASVFHHLVDTLGFDESRVFLYGCSAGANMAILTTHWLLENGSKPPGALVLSSPGDIVASFQNTEAAHQLAGQSREELALSSPESIRVIYDVDRFPSLSENHNNSYLSNEFRQIVIRNIGDEALELSVLHRDYTGFPPSRVLAGATDIFRDHQIELGEKIRAAGSDVVVETPPGMWHCPFSGNGIVPEARQAVRRAAKWLEPLISS